MSAHLSAPPSHENTKPDRPDIKGDPMSDSSPSNTQQKRKAPSPIPAPDHATPPSPKRSRTHDQPREPASREPRIDRRELARQEEKKRGKRLLGGLMNTLNQAGARPGALARKRPDLDRRQQIHQIHQTQQTKSTQQRADEDRLRATKLARLDSVRRAEQLNFQEQAMKTKHADMLSKASYLRTDTRPHIYYLPWELTRSQRDRLEDQKRDAEEIISKELYRLNERKTQPPRDSGKEPDTTQPKGNEPVGEQRSEEPTNNSPQPLSANTSRSPSTNKPGLAKEVDRDRADDVMIEEDEDTVIY